MFALFSCAQVTGKAVMLDEIINYVQSLQRQIEVSTATVLSSLGSINDVLLDSCNDCLYN